MSKEKEKPIIDDSYQHKKNNSQNNVNFWEDMSDSMSVARARSQELSEFVAVNHEFLDGKYREPEEQSYGSKVELANGARENNSTPDQSNLLNGARENNYNDEPEGTTIINGSTVPNDDSSTTSLMNGRVNAPAVQENNEYKLENGARAEITELPDEQTQPKDGEEADVELKNMSNAYAYSSDLAYTGVEVAKTAVKDSDTYRGGHMVHDVVRMATGAAAMMSAQDSMKVFIDYASSSNAKEVNEIFARNGQSFNSFIFVDPAKGNDYDNLKFKSSAEVRAAFQEGKSQIESYLNKQGLNVSGIKNRDIAASIESGVFNFGLQKGMKLTEDEKKILTAYLNLNNLQLSMGKEQGQVATAGAVGMNILKGTVRGSDAYQGFRQMQSLKRAGGRVVFKGLKAPGSIAAGSAKFTNRMMNARYSIKMKNANPAQRAKLSAEILGKNKEFAEKMAKRNARLGKLNSIQNFYNASAFGKARIISSKVGDKIKSTERYKNSFLGKMGEKRTQKQLLKQQKNPKRYQRKQKRIQRRKKISRGIAYVKKYLYMIGAGLAIIILVISFAGVCLTTFIGETPFSGDKLATTEYNNVRQEAMDSSITSFQNAINWISTNSGSTKYSGQLYEVTIRYPDGTSKTYKRDSADAELHIKKIIPDEDYSTIKKLKIPWTYNGAKDGGGTLAAPGYLGQSVVEQVYQLDDDDVIIEEGPEISRRDLELYSEVINMPIMDEWVSAFSTRPQYKYDNWNGVGNYRSGGKVKFYSMDDFYKAISSMAVEVCDITGYDDTDGKFYKKYFQVISDMALKNSYYSLKITTVPKAEHMQYLDDAGSVYKDNAYLVHCQIYIHVDASINDLMELADHYDPINHTFTNRTNAITKWRQWINATLTETGADNTGYEGTRVYKGFFNTDSSSFAFNSNYGSYRDTSGFAYNYDNMTDEGNTACSYLYEGLTLDEWINDLGFVFLNAYSIDGGAITGMAPLYSPEQIEDYITQIKSNYYLSTGTELSEQRVGFLRQCFGDVGRFYYAFGGKANDISNPPMGLDCSGFVGYELAKYGLTGNAVVGTGALSGMGTQTTNSAKKPGDIIVKYDPDNDTDLHWSSHVVIYAGSFDVNGGGNPIEHTIECTTRGGITGSQVLSMSSRTEAKGYKYFRKFMD